MLKKDEFISEISKLSGYVDEKTVELVYYAMVRVLSRQLREHKTVKLPDWGEFYLHRNKPRQSLNINSKNFEYLGAKTSVKFNPDYKIKEYFKEMNM